MPKAERIIHGWLRQTLWGHAQLASVDGVETCAYWITVESDKEYGTQNVHGQYAEERPMSIHPFFG